MKKNFNIIAGMLGLGVVIGVTFGEVIPCGNFLKQERICSQNKIRITSTKYDNGILKTFQTSNGEISYLVDEFAEKSIDEIIFYKEQLDKKPVTAEDLMSLYRVIDSNYDNWIDLDETTPYKSVFRRKYHAKSLERLKK